jgi:hypothetical protein
VYRAAQRSGKGWCTAWCTDLSDRELAAIFDEAEQEKPLAAVLRGGPGRPRTGEDNPCDRKDIAYGTAEHWKARLHRDDPETAERVERGKLSALKTERGPGVRLSRSA